MGSGLGRKRACLACLEALIAPSTRVKFALTMQGAARILAAALSGSSLRVTGCVSTQPRIRSHSTPGGQSVLMPSGLACVLETLWPAGAAV